MPQQDIQQLFKHSKNPKLIREALDFAQDSYQDDLWLSGEKYFDHACRVMLILHDMKVDEATIVSGLLSNVANNSDKEQQQPRLKAIEKNFGPEVSKLASRASEVNKIYYSVAIDVKEKRASKEEKLENIRNMFFAIAQDVRVILIKLAARIDGMQHLASLPQDMQTVYATETMQIFAPIANRLGLGEIKRQLEDLAFEHLHQADFTWLQENIKEQYRERKIHLERFAPRIKKILSRENIIVSAIDSRAKSYWSTYQKLQRHDMDFEKIYDLVALRVIVKDIASCYKALGIIHEHFQPISGQIQDYIAKPKANGYQSIHTTVFLEPGMMSEIQIRTLQMHQEAQFGICAHWAYKEKLRPTDPKTLQWSKGMPELFKTFKIDFFANRVFAFTPKGDVIVLPKGSTPIDFAYAVHSDVGNHCESAKIDGKIIPLSQELKNGDVVEIVTSQKKFPSQDWLRFVKTNFAKLHIKRSTLLKIPASVFSLPFYITKKISEISSKARKTQQQKKQFKKETPSQLYIAGQKGIMANVAKCCSPTQNDQVKAYLTMQHAAVLHKVSCQNLQHLLAKSPERVVDADWKQS